jgi:hypothetical protein
MKRFIFIIVAGFIFLFICTFMAGYIWIGHSVKENISIAKKQYPGKAEDALIAYLLDTNNSPRDRTHVAVWTLGQIRSEKALPVLRELYKDDPEGKTCYGKHDSVLCQYEIYKAIHADQVNWWPSHRRLNK